MKDFHCRDAGMSCDFVARGTSEKEIVAQAGQHAQQVHSMALTPDLADRVRGLIHDESSDAHRRSMSAAGSSPSP
jgi:predicted small metal-binding protein